jgi:hypothetical protein
MILFFVFASASGFGPFAIATFAFAKAKEAIEEVFCFCCFFCF